MTHSNQKKIQSVDDLYTMLTEMNSNYQSFIKTQERAIQDRERTIESQGRAIEKQNNVLSQQVKAIETLHSRLEKQAKVLEDISETFDQMDDYADTYNAQVAELAKALLKISEQKAQAESKIEELSRVKDNAEKAVALMDMKKQMEIEERIRSDDLFARERLAKAHFDTERKINDNYFLLSQDAINSGYRQYMPDLSENLDELIKAEQEKFTQEAREEVGLSNAKTLLEYFAKNSLDEMLYKIGADLPSLPNERSVRTESYMDSKNSEDQPQQSKSSEDAAQSTSKAETKQAETKQEPAKSSETKQTQTKQAPAKSASQKSKQSAPAKQETKQAPVEQSTPTHRVDSVEPIVYPQDNGGSQQMDDEVMRLFEEAGGSFQ